MPAWAWSSPKFWIFNKSGVESSNLSNLTSTTYRAPRRTVSELKKKTHFELRPQEVCLRPYVPSGIASHVYFLKWPREGRSVVFLLMWLHRPRLWLFLSPENSYFSNCDCVLLGVRYVTILLLSHHATSWIWKGGVIPLKKGNFFTLRPGWTSRYLAT
jgi:hypothetical protein